MKTTVSLLTGVLFLFFSSVASASVADSTEVEKRVIFSFDPSLGLTLSSYDKTGTKGSAFQWLANVSADYNYRCGSFDLGSKLFASYGESKVKGEQASVLNDKLILSVTPSFRIIKIPAIRLFLETTAETALRAREPLFLYQTIFIGQKHYSSQNNENLIWNITYGAGYSFQQTFARGAQVLNSTNSNSDFESGLSAIADISIDYKFKNGFSLFTSMKGVVLSKGDLSGGLRTARKSILLRSGLFYKSVGLEYNYHFVKDPVISPFVDIEHSLMFTLRFR